MPEIIDARHLDVRFGQKNALRRLNLQIEDRGHVIGLFGQNGAGKSTLLRSICGVINRFDGTIAARPPSVAYLPDAAFLYPWLTVSACIELGAALWDDFDPDVARMVFDELGLAHDLRVRQASKGMSEQIHLGLVLARRCQMYVLDEPLAAVDPFTRDRLIEMIRRRRSPGSTVVISTHLVAGLESLFDEAVVVHNGTVVLHQDTVGLAHGELENCVKAVIAADALAH